MTGVTAGDTDSLYILGEKDGKIALFDCRDMTPIHIFDRETAQLPEADRKALEKGIIIDGNDELRQRLEDFF